MDCFDENNEESRQAAQLLKNMQTVNAVKEAS